MSTTTLPSGLTLADLAPMIREALKDKRYRASSLGGFGVITRRDGAC